MLAESFKTRRIFVCRERSASRRTSPSVEVWISICTATSAYSPFLTGGSDRIDVTRISGRWVSGFRRPWRKTPAAEVVSPTNRPFSHFSIRWT